MLVGGAEADRLQARANEDILINVTTLYDPNVAALSTSLAKWATNVDDATPVAHLMGSPRRLDHSYFLNASTVLDDGVFEVLYEGEGLDWFIHRDPG
jgi:hypothetical protein